MYVASVLNGVGQLLQSIVASIFGCRLAISDSLMRFGGVRGAHPSSRQHARHTHVHKHACARAQARVRAHKHAQDMGKGRHKAVADVVQAKLSNNVKLELMSNN